jgi:ribosomal protein L11 methylase PrmA
VTEAPGIDDPSRRDPASYRDPAGYVFRQGTRIFRAVAAPGLPDYEAFAASRCFEALQEKGWLQPSREVTDMQPPQDARKLLEHPALPIVTYSYEWPFEMLRSAALLHLRMHRALLAAGFNLKDASSFNIQFDGASPRFIDLLSIRPYRDGEYWLAHDQFVRHFLTPLLLESYTAIPAQPWLRASLEGIDPGHVATLLPLRARLNVPLWLHLFLPVKLESRAGRGAQAPRPARPLPRKAFDGLLRQLEALVASLRPPRRKQTAWSDYANATSYAREAEEAKDAAVGDFVRATRPGRLVDLGCNDGRYSRIALAAGAARVFGLDSDVAALDRAFINASRGGWNFTPIVQDLANPSPGQGWLNEERPSILTRLQADVAIALAVVHHLAIGRNVPLVEVARMLLRLAPQALVEFVPKDDPMVKLMLSQREDVFADYGMSGFIQAIGEAGGEVVRSRSLPGSSRELLHVRRAQA